MAVRTVCASPTLCAVGCMVVFWCVRVGNTSRRKLVRAIGRIPVLGRYFVFVGITCGLASGGAVAVVRCIVLRRFDDVAPGHS